MFDLIVDHETRVWIKHAYKYSRWTWNLPDRVIRTSDSEVLPLGAEPRENPGIRHPCSMGCGTSWSMGMKPGLGTQVISTLTLV